MLKNKKLFLVFICLFICFTLISCDKLAFFDKLKFKGKQEAEKSKETKYPSGPVLARVDNWYMSLDDFNEKIKNLQLLAPDFKVETFDDKKALLDEFIRQELLVQEAKRRSLEKTREVKEAMDEFLRGLLVREIINKEIENITVSAEEIEAYYNQYQDGFKEVEQFHVREIVVRNEREAKDILIELLKGADFVSLASQRSISNTAKEAGDLGFIEVREFPHFANALISLEPGGVSNVFKGPDGYYIIKLEEKKGGKILTLSEVWDDIKNGLLIIKQNQYIQDFIAKLRQNVKIEISEDLLR